MSIYECQEELIIEDLPPTQPDAPLSPTPELQAPYEESQSDELPIYSQDLEYGNGEENEYSDGESLSEIASCPPLTFGELHTQTDEIPFPVALLSRQRTNSPPRDQSVEENPPKRQKTGDGSLSPSAIDERDELLALLNDTDSEEEEPLIPSSLTEPKYGKTAKHTSHNNPKDAFHFPTDSEASEEVIPTILESTKEPTKQPRSALGQEVAKEPTKAPTREHGKERDKEPSNWLNDSGSDPKWTKKTGKKAKRGPARTQKGMKANQTQLRWLGDIQGPAAGRSESPWDFFRQTQKSVPQHTQWISLLAERIPDL